MQDRYKSREVLSIRCLSLLGFIRIVENTKMFCPGQCNRWTEERRGGVFSATRVYII